MLDLCLSRPIGMVLRIQRFLRFGAHHQKGLLPMLSLLMAQVLCPCVTQRLAGRSLRPLSGIMSLRPFMNCGSTSCGDGGFQQSPTPCLNTCKLLRGGIFFLVRLVWPMDADHAINSQKTHDVLLQQALM